MVNGNGQWQQPLKRIAFTGQKIKFQNSSTHDLTYRHLGLYPKKSVNKKITRTQRSYSSTYSSHDTRTSKMLSDRLKVKEDVVCAYSGALLSYEKPPLEF